MPLPKPYRHTDGRSLCLGKLPPKADSKRFMLENYLALAPPPPDANWFKDVVNYGEMLNDHLGDCTCAAAGHATQVATLNAPYGEITPPDPVILNVYEKACGYVPGDPNTDQGGVITDVLDWVRQHGIGIRKDDPERHHKPTLFGYADTNPGNIDHIKQAIAILGIVDIGLQLPLSAQAQVGGLWDVVEGPSGEAGSWGGHSVVVCAYDTDTLTCITWGQLQRMTWRFWTAYVDESHALLMDAWLDQFGARSGVNLEKFEADLLALNN